MNEQIVILDFGSQYTQVIARRVRECNVYSTILRFDTPAAEIAALKRLPDEVEPGKEDPTRDVFTKGKWFRVPVLPVNFYGHKGGV